MMQKGQKISLKHTHTHTKSERCLGRRVTGKSNSSAQTTFNGGADLQHDKGLRFRPLKG